MVGVCGVKGEGREVRREGVKVGVYSWCGVCGGRTGELEDREGDFVKRGVFIKLGNGGPGRRGVEGVEREVRASVSSWVVSGRVGVVVTPLLAATPADNTRGTDSGLAVIVKVSSVARDLLSSVGIFGSMGELTSCIRSSPPSRFWSRNSRPS